MRKRKAERRHNEAMAAIKVVEEALRQFPGDPAYERSLRIWRQRLLALDRQEQPKAKT